MCPHHPFPPPFYPLNQTRYLGVTIGIGLLLETDKLPEDLVRRADQAMYDAKKSGRNCYRFAKEKRGNEKENYEPQVQEKSLRNCSLERSSIND